MLSTETVAILGLGYVGLPLALAMAKNHAHVVGFDIAPSRIAALAAFAASPPPVATPDIPSELHPILRSGRLSLTSNPADLAPATVFIIAVPTPITASRRPDLGALERAADTVAQAIKKGALVVVESTVAPGTTVDLVAPRIAAFSGLVPHVDFDVAYSPERINPGDPVHALECVPKVVAAHTPNAFERVSAIYRAAIPAGIIAAPSIAAAELAKLVENTQRDLNVALMNELAIICDRLGLRTADVLGVARTKWNFLPFEPGLVGGHCISVDPWYLADLAESLGLHPEVVAAGRRTNDALAAFVAQKTMKLLASTASPAAGGRRCVGVFGVTFKEDFPDIRNSQALVLCAELADFGVEVVVVDPVADPLDVQRVAGIVLTHPAVAVDLDALVLAVRHADFVNDIGGLFARVRPGGVIVDVKSAIAPTAVPDGVRYWSL